MTEPATGASPWAIPWPCLHEFYAVATHPRVYSPPSTPSQAVAQVEAWLESPSLVLLAESPAHWTTLKDLVSRARVQGSTVHDARVAALCLQHGVKTLWSADRASRALRRFTSSIRWSSDAKPAPRRLRRQAAVDHRLQPRRALRGRRRRRSSPRGFRRTVMLLETNGLLAALDESQRRTSA